MFKKKKKQAPQNLTEEEKIERNIKRKRRLIKQIKKDIIIKIIVFTGAFVIAFTVFFGVTFAPTNDMYPAVHKGDLLIYYRLGVFIKTDIVIYEEGGERQIGRIAATEGSLIDRTDGGLVTIDGNIQPIQKRSGLYYKTEIKEDGLLGYPTQVSHDEYLVLGDDRELAKDSRDFGLIPRKHIKGKIFTIIRRRPV